MPAESEEPLRKVTLNLFASDVAWAEKEFGRGWTEQIRILLRRFRHRKENPLYVLTDSGEIRRVRE